MTPLNVVVVTYDFDRDRASMLRSNWASPAASFPRLQRSYVMLADAVHASSTAPVNWFDMPAQLGQARYWDGAMTGYNNPVLAGVSDAIAQGVNPRSIAALSIGTSATALPLVSDRLDPKLCRSWAPTDFLSSVAKVGKTIISDPPEAHNYLAHLMTGGRAPTSLLDCPVTRTSIIRMNPLIQPVPSPDFSRELMAPLGWTPDEFAQLANLDIATTSNEEVDLIKRLCRDWMKDIWHNQPIRYGNYPPDAGYSVEHYWEIGHQYYSRAKRDWLRMTAPPDNTLLLGLLV